MTKIFIFVKRIWGPFFYLCVSNARFSSPASILVHPPPPTHTPWWQLHRLGEHSSPSSRALGSLTYRKPGAPLPLTHGPRFASQDVKPKHPSLPTCAKIGGQLRFAPDLLLYSKVSGLQDKARKEKT